MCSVIHGELYSIQHCVIKFISDLPPGTPVSFINKTDRHDITEILLKVSLNSINQSKPNQHFVQYIEIDMKVNCYYNEVKWKTSHKVNITVVGGK